MNIPRSISLTAFCFLFAQATSFSCDVFLIIDTIEGSSTDPEHPKSIEVISWQYGADQHGTIPANASSSAGKVNIHDLSIVKVMDKSSAKLFQSCVAGTHYNTAVLIVRNASSSASTPTPTPTATPSPTPSGPGDYLKVTLSDVIISGVTVDGSSGGGDCVPTETVTLSFTKIEFDYSAANGANSNGMPAHVGYNVKNNKF